MYYGIIITKKHFIMTKNNILQEEDARKLSLSELNSKNIEKLKKKIICSLYFFYFGLNLTVRSKSIQSSRESD